jgi:hypothetical protein
MSSGRLISSQISVTILALRAGNSHYICTQVGLRQGDGPKVTETIDGPTVLSTLKAKETGPVRPR